MEIDLERANREQAAAKKKSDKVSVGTGAGVRVHVYECRLGRALEGSESGLGLRSGWKQG